MFIRFWYVKPFRKGIINTYELMWGLGHQKQVSMLWISNHIPQYSQGCIVVSARGQFVFLRKNNWRHIAWQSDRNMRCFLFVQNMQCDLHWAHTLVIKPNSLSEQRSIFACAILNADRDISTACSISCINDETCLIHKSRIMNAALRTEMCAVLCIVGYGTGAFVRLVYCPLWSHRKLTTSGASRKISSMWRFFRFTSSTSTVYPMICLVLLWLFLIQVLQIHIFFRVASLTLALVSMR